MATLYMNRSDSECGACGKNAFPQEEGHFTLAGWYLANDGERQPGCGERWTAVSSHYSDIIKSLPHHSGPFMCASLLGLPIIDYDGNVVGKYGSAGTFDELM